MGDWFRSATVLVMAFVGAMVVTIGLANAIVPGGPAGSQAADGDGGGATPEPTFLPIRGIGGHLAVTGDQEGTLTVTRESNQDRYSLLGDDGRIVFEGANPPVVAQVSWNGLEFFPEPEDCTITPGALDHETGIGRAELACANLSDVRGGGTVSMAGELGLALTMVGESDLPEMGGSVTVGDETWEFGDALLFQFPVNFGAGTEDYNMMLTDEDRGIIRFRYDVQTHRLTLTQIGRGETQVPQPFEGEITDLPPGACSLQTNELGRMTPGTAVVELTIDCPTAEVPGMGTVPIAGTVVVQNVEFIP